MRIKENPLSPQEIQKLEKNYTKNEPEQFLAMYDAIRDNDKNKSYFIIEIIPT